MSLEHIVEIVIDSWIFKFGEKVEVKLIDLGIMSTIEILLSKFMR